MSVLITALAIALSPPADPGTAAAKPKQDPNEMVCEKQRESGSRLSVKRVCMTRAEWADRRLQDRQAIDKAQVERGTAGN